MSHTKADTLKRLSHEHYRARFLSAEALERKVNPISSLAPLERTPGVISLLAGKPNPTTFPIASLSLSARAPGFKSGDNESDTAGGAGDLVNLKLSDEALKEALQYGEGGGVRQFLGWICGLQEKVHGRTCELYKRGIASEGWKIMIGVGSLDAFYKAIKSIVNPGDPVLLESPTYATVLPTLHSLHCSQIGIFRPAVQTDEDGVSVPHLRSILETWPKGKPKPKVFYTIPTGSNPTGATATTERRIEVLKLAREHDFLILEDDPYYFVYYGDTPRPPSYFNLEAKLAETEGTEVGRVVRFDSFSKLLSAGLRIGWASGPEPIIDVMIQFTMTVHIHTPSMTQMLTYTLLSSPSWGHDGLLVHAERISQFYRQKRDAFEALMQKYLGAGATSEDAPLAKWTKPAAGLFFWFEIIVDKSTGGNSETLIRTKAFQNGVLALPGAVFLPGNEQGKTGYVRASFSLLDEGHAEEALKRLRKTILQARNEFSRGKL
ncbi:hypothetical protein V5O48_005142 [Marasmius crinis-equi]|uniref:Aminotransferase class I/classII large domain-containing protein n=1 Tax=Marasmius crinis-equi TaxID=585013 RepID=A0ABR3FN69_9AGAR